VLVLNDKILGELTLPSKEEEIETVWKLSMDSIRRRR